MGNAGSTVEKNATENNTLKPKGLSQTLDYIATYYILTMEFENFTKLYEPEYCDKITILTGDIISKYYTDMDITFLLQRIKSGEEINEMTKQKVIFYNNDNIKQIDQTNSIKKKRICIGIAKFYIKIAHLFAAIMTTVNPIYVYKDASGNEVKTDIYKKGEILANTPRTIYRCNICDNRINALLHGQGQGNKRGPSLCKNNNKQTLFEEPGIKELMKLYNDDEYDYKTGAFKGMSINTKQQYESDLKLFNDIFSNDRTTVINTFSDIKLHNYETEPKEKDNVTTNVTTTNNINPLSTSLISKYAENLKLMIKNSDKKRDELIDVLNKVFVYSMHPTTGTKQIRISPSLTENTLQTLIEQTRKMIVNLYLSCEADYLTGTKIYEAIVEQKILETSKNQINTLETLRDNVNVN